MVTRRGLWAKYALLEAHSCSLLLFHNFNYLCSIGVDFQNGFKGGSLQ